MCGVYRYCVLHNVGGGKRASLVAPKVSGGSDMVWRCGPDMVCGVRVAVRRGAYFCSVGLRTGTTWMDIR